MLGVVLGNLCLQLCVSIFFSSEMLAAQVLVCQLDGLKCWNFCGCWMQGYFCTFRLGSSVGISADVTWVEVLEVVLIHSMLYHLSDKLAAQILVCLLFGWIAVLEVLRMLDEQVLVYLSVGLKCWKFCWESCANTLYASTIFPCSLQTSWPPRYLCACLWVGLKGWKYHLPFRNVGCTGTCVPISWVEVLEVLLLGELC